MRSAARYRDYVRERLGVTYDAADVRGIAETAIRAAAATKDNPATTGRPCRRARSTSPARTWGSAFVLSRKTVAPALRCCSRRAGPTGRWDPPLRYVRGLPRRRRADGQDGMSRAPRRMPSQRPSRTTTWPACMTQRMPAGPRRGS
ncbi:hypothetical protein SVIO_071250 [Streptomyces violaceusniger]|uniref:Uncharacterized protein n=1 Tax=Streptomyces violaceusniger TaxID=68280 RepID=A0A4D4L5S0_STRVO|nr:hypothetical protein SVIO_071250 [Streptomyces violaceusniger]